jgi:hypothetical protein
MFCEQGEEDISLDRHRSGSGVERVAHVRRVCAVSAGGIILGFAAS